MMVIYDGNGFISSRDYSSRSARGINIVFFKQFHKSGNSERINILTIILQKLGPSSV